jgi:hypothetical protein
MRKSLNKIWGNELLDLGFKKSKVNHFKKKYKNHLFCIDYDLMGFILMFRILGLNALGKSECIKYIEIKEMSSMTRIGFVNLVNKIEKEFVDVVDKQASASF